jgi:2-methylcitrate dehydratase PrpD
VSLSVHPLVGELTNIYSPATGLEGKFSARHCLAAGFVLDHVGSAAFTDKAVNDPAITSVRNLVTVIVDPAIPHMETRVEAVLEDGRIVETAVDNARGTAGNPLDAEGLMAKFIDVTSPRWAPREAAWWHDRLLAIGSEPSVKVLAEDIGKTAPAH